MEIIYGRDQEVSDFVAQGLGILINVPHTTIGCASGNRLIGGAVFTDFNGANIELTVFGPGSLSRKFIRAWFTYVFEQLGCLRLTAKTKRSNVVARKLLPRLGFDFEGTLKHFYGPTRGDDVLVFRLTPEFASRWM